MMPPNCTNSRDRAKFGRLLIIIIILPTGTVRTNQCNPVQTSEGHIRSDRSSSDLISTRPAQFCPMPAAAFVNSFGIISSLLLPGTTKLLTGSSGNR